MLKIIDLAHARSIPMDGGAAGKRNWWMRRWAGRLSTYT